jgi:tetratricopeptide (TPR) repeat protein
MLKVQPGHVDALHLLGVIAAQTRRPREAVDLIEKAIAIKPDRAAFHNNRGLALRDLKRLNEALASFEQALELEPGLFDAFNNRGMVLQELGRFDEALACYEQALALAPGFAHAHNNRGSVLRDLERYDEALDSHNRALAISPDYAQAILNRGNVLRSQWKLDAAIADYEKALDLDPGFAEAYTCLASALQERGDIEEASRSYARAISIEPNNISPLLHLSRLHEGMLPEHLTSLWLRNMPEIAEATTEPEQLFVKGNLLRHSGEIQEAFDNYLLANALIHRDRPGQNGSPGNGEEELLTRLKHWQPRKPIARNSGKVKFLFILGASRSGKSTIESIVGNSDRVRKGYEGWRGGSARRTLDRIHDSPGGYPLDDPSEIESAVAAYLFYYGAAEVARDGYQVLTCTNPFAIEVAHLVFDILPSSYFIFVQRDAISNAAEIFVTWYSDRMDHAYDPETALDHVNWYRCVTDELAAKMEGRSMVMDYGEFLGDTASGIRSIEKLIDLDLGVEQGLSGFAGRDEKSAFRECFLNELERRGVR